jgi:3-oxoacyl-[acyl-carrier protein] reductase
MTSEPAGGLRPASASLEGRVAIVTGAARGLGLAITRRLAAEGATVALVDMNAGLVEQQAAKLAGGGVDARAIVTDVTNADQVGAAVRTVVDAYGGVDILVNNAGITGPAKPLVDYSEIEWSQVIDVDLTSTFLMCRAVLPHMLRRQAGKVVNIASISGKEGNPNMVAYSAAKAAVIGLTKALAKEVATSGVYVNCVTPAVVHTEILDQLTPETVDYMVSRIPMGRTGRPEEIAGLVAWLSSDECSFSTGAVFDISGGRATY